MGLTQAEIHSLLTKEIERKPSGIGLDVFDLHKFNKSAAFLLELRFDNLFEPASAKPGGSFLMRCKGCNQIVRWTERESHFTWHKRELS